MYSSCYLSKRVVFIYIMAIELLIRSVLSLNLTNEYLHHKCLTHEGTYNLGSEYEKNLNGLIRHLSTEAYIKGFTHTTEGKAPDSVTIVFQCRGDSFKSKCRSCFATAVAGLRRRCQRNKGAIIWYDQCILGVSKINRSKMKIDYENTLCMHNKNDVNGDTRLFNKKTKDLLYELTVKAEKTDKDGLQFLYYATGEFRFGTKTLYAMVQCAQDTADCEGCLDWSIKQLFKCSDGKEGARFLGTSCNLRYELYPFLRS